MPKRIARTAVPPARITIVSGMVMVEPPHVEIARDFRNGSDSALRQCRPRDRSCVVSGPEFAITACRGSATTRHPLIQGCGHRISPGYQCRPGRHEGRRAILLLFSVEYRS